MRIFEETDGKLLREDLGGCLSQTRSETSPLWTASSSAAESFPCHLFGPHPH